MIALRQIVLPPVGGHKRCIAALTVGLWSILSHTHPASRLVVMIDHYHEDATDMRSMLLDIQIKVHHQVCS